MVRVVLISLLLAGCAKSGTLEPGAPVSPPMGVDSLCENNPEECDAE